MPYYIRRGNIPHKRHTQFRKADGSLYSEQLFSTEGFSAESSLLYHLHPPTVITDSLPGVLVKPQAAEPELLKPRSFQGSLVLPCGDYLDSRNVILFNSDCRISLAAPMDSITNYFVKNAGADECIFVHEGTGALETIYGIITFGPGDYLVIPRGTIYRLNFDGTHNRLLVIESTTPFRFPKRYLSDSGQLLEHAPFCERDLRTPEHRPPIDKEGHFEIKVLKGDYVHPVMYRYHPFDVEGWDGCCYPFALSIHDFEPVTGRVHQPPPVHQTFATGHFVVCSFVPRLYDYHPESVPAPYNHSNIDSDELLYYVDGDFMSRKHVTRGMISLHPAGIPHGPHPGAVEKSIGQKGTNELAVMIDTFRPLQLTENALHIEDKDYYKSWNE